MTKEQIKNEILYNEELLHQIQSTMNVLMSDYNKCDRWYVQVNCLLEVLRKDLEKAQ